MPFLCNPQGYLLVWENEGGLWVGEPLSIRLWTPESRTLNKPPPREWYPWHFHSWPCGAILTDDLLIRKCLGILFYLKKKNQKNTCECLFLKSHRNFQRWNTKLKSWIWEATNFTMGARNLKIKNEECGFLLCIYWKLVYLPVESLIRLSLLLPFSREMKMPKITLTLGLWLCSTWPVSLVSVTEWWWIKWQLIARHQDTWQIFASCRSAWPIPNLFLADRPLVLKSRSR